MDHKENTPSTSLQQQLSPEEFDAVLEENKFLQEKIELINKISKSPSLEEVLNEILLFLNGKWGFNTLSSQIVDEKTNTLKFFTFNTVEKLDGPINEAITVDVPLEKESSISAAVAISQKWFYADFERTKKNLERLSELDRNSLDKMGLIENLIVPVIDEGKTISVFHLGSTDNRTNLNKDICNEIFDFLNNLSSHIQIIKNKIEQENLKTQQQETLDLFSKLVNTIKLDEILDILGDEIDKLDSVDGYCINIFDKNNNQLICNKVSLSQEYKIMEKTYQKFVFPVKKGNENHKAIYDKQVIDIDNTNLSGFSSITSARYMAWKMKHLIIIPIAKFEDIDSQAIGTIMIFNENNKVDGKSIQTIKDKLFLFVDPIDNANKYSDFKEKERLIDSAVSERTRFLNFLNDVNNLTLLEKIYKMLSMEFLNLYKFDLIGILIEENGYLKRVSSYSKGEKYKNYLSDWDEFMDKNPYKTKSEEGAFSLCYVKNQHLFFPYIPDLLHLPMSKKDSGALNSIKKTISTLHFPIRKDGKAIGVITASSLDQKIELSGADIEFMEILGSFFGSAITNAKMYTTVEHQKEEIEATLQELETTKDKLVETERKRADAMRKAKEIAEASVEAKSNFLANMSHEIRTPMNAITGLTYLALRMDLTPKLEDYLQKINASSETLLGIINDILDFSKIEAGKLDLEKTEFSLLDIISHISDIFATKVAEKQLELFFKPDIDMPICVIGDPLRLSQVLINIINNAVKFTESGEIQVNISTKKASEEKVTLEFSVIDSGIGIDKKVLPTLFDSFTQANGSTSRKFGGTGLGLSISKRLVELMGGKLIAKSALGNGSIFSFTTQFEPPEGGFNNISKIVENISEEIKGKKIVVAAHNDKFSDYLANALQDHNFIVETVSSGSEILEMMSKYARNIHMVIVDTSIPDDGISALQQVNNIKSMSGVKTAILTAFGNDDHLSSQIVEQTDLILHKPIKMTELINSICISLGSEQDGNVIYESSANKCSAYNEIEVEKNVRGATVLLTDDNRINQQVASELLERVGIIVDIANNGLEAVNKLKVNKYDVVFMDLEMPVMGGIEATKIIRDSEHTKDQTIIAMTANAMQSDRTESIEAGMNDYIAKPIKTEALYKLLLQYLKTNKRSNVLDFESSGHKDLERLIKTHNIKNQTIENAVIHNENLQIVNLEEALRMLANNKKLLVSIANDFIDSYEESPYMIDKHINNDELTDAKRLVHSIKGIASTFACDAFYNAAIEFELALKNRQKKLIENTFDNYKEIFEVFLNDVRWIAGQ
ncbi:MAG: response regulator [Gammaproteobacteria bacterium]|nr:MAG: response regulator [Gammaproteobacteria bacterium]